MTLVDSVLAQARASLGLCEAPPGSNRTPIGTWYGMDGNPWCAMAVSFWFFHGGFPLKITTDKGFAYCPYGVAWAKQQGLWAASTTSEPGDVIFFGSGGLAEHTGIVEVGWNGSCTTTIEGNTGLKSQNNGGEVMRKQRSAGDWTLGVAKTSRLLRAAAGPVSPVVVAPAAPAGVATVGPPWPGRYLGLTSPHTCGDDVRTWQARMAERTWKLDVDGEYGTQSSDICSAFQAEKGLEKDGVVGPATWSAAWTAAVT